MQSMASNRTSDYKAKTKESQKLHGRAMKVMPGGDTRSVTFHQPYPSYIESASGCRLTTEDGEILLDFLNNYTQSVLGHAPPEVVEAVTSRFERGNGVGAPTEDAVLLAERLVDRVPSLDKIRFGNSGTEATMNAIRAAMAYTGSERVLKVHGGYHGTHDTVEVAVEDDGREHVGIPKDVERRVMTTPFNNVEELINRFDEHGNDFACFILEPLLGVAGAIPPHPEYLKTARDLTAKYDVPLIFDEVMTLRLGHGGAQERYDVTPDLTALGKFIGGGLPIGAFGGREDLMNAFHPTEGVAHHSGTFNANPATMAGGVATLELLDRESIRRLNDLGDRLRTGARNVISKYDVDMTVTGDGSMFQLHHTDASVVRAESAAADSDTFEDMFLEMRNRGVFMAPRGMGNISTPMSSSEIDKFLGVLDESLSAIQA